jgi:hypothetical protein
LDEKREWMGYDSTIKGCAAMVTPETKQEASSEAKK